MCLAPQMSLIYSLESGDTAALSANQFNPLLGQRVDVVFSVAQGSSYARLLIYNVAGQKVRTVESSSAVVPDITYTQLLFWDGRADDGMFVTTGIYYIKLVTENFEAVKMIAVIKK
jgi:flagellar hook assembly protein FlgD